MSQSQIEDILDRLNNLTDAMTLMAAEMAVVKALARLSLIVGGGMLTGLGSIGLAVFVWWLNKH